MHLQLIIKDPLTGPMAVFVLFCFKLWSVNPGFLSSRDSFACFNLQSQLVPPPF